MKMKSRIILLPVLLSIALVFSLILTASMLNAAPVMARGQSTLVAGDNTVSARFYHPPECDVGDWTDIVQVAAAWHHTVGLKSDRTVVAVGDNRWEQCDVGGWTDIIQVAAGGDHTVGVKSDGTVVAVGRNNGGCCEVGNWTGIKQTAAGHYHTVGLKNDGTVVDVGPSGWSRNDYGQCDVGNWTDIIQVAAGDYHTVGLKDDGTAVAVGDNDVGQCDISNWTYIKQVAAGYDHTVGLKSDGTVVALGFCKLGQCDVGNWVDITQVAAGFVHTVGLKSDGTVVAAPDDEDFNQCNVGAWTDIIKVAAGREHTVGLKSDRTVVAVCIWLTDIVPGSGCFIATAAYGTRMAEEIQILREFRDGYLLTNPVGKALVELYYRVSPPIAEFITGHPALKPIVRAGLLPAVAVSATVLNTTLAEKVAILGLLVLISVALAVWAKRRRGRGPQYTRG
jgi:alpha-tubulin suppressor-like RCC1 family protein